MIKFRAILTTEEALKAVEQNVEALQYVLSRELFCKIAKKLGIETDQKEHSA